MQTKTAKPKQIGAWKARSAGRRKRRPSPTRILPERGARVPSAKGKNMTDVPSSMALYTRTGFVVSISPMAPPRGWISKTPNPWCLAGSLLPLWRQEQLSRTSSIGRAGAFISRSIVSPRLRIRLQTTRKRWWQVQSLVRLPAKQRENLPFCSRTMIVCPFRVAKFNGLQFWGASPI